MPTTRPGYIWSGTEWIAIGQEAAVAPVSYQATAPTSPATGDIWIDSDDEVPGITSSLNYRWRKIATGGETSLSGNDTSGLPLAYNPGYEQVYLNGVLLYRGSDYIATTGNTITGLTALVANDTIEVLSFVTAPIGDTYTQAAARGLFVSKAPTVVQFTTTGTTSWTVPAGVGLVDVLVVAGGGGGGYDVGGGGGAGGLIYKENHVVTPGASVTVTVGAGGAMTNNGGNSVFGSLTAIGGGYGGNYPNGIGASGGSGGGGCGYSAPGYAGSGTAGQGYSGGPQNFGASTTQLTGSGGGGAGGPGGPGVYFASGFAEGGPGFLCSITGTLIAYAKGGRGAGDNWPNAATGTVNSGNGGDAGGIPNDGKSGGSGIVIVRYSV
jgi:hypothetical protein